jgi:hypothetical protein
MNEIIVYDCSEKLKVQNLNDLVTLAETCCPVDISDNPEMGCDKKRCKKYRIVVEEIS